ncbi:glutamine amidotransferase [Cladophialophora yegresii CBS 114405]|uniref:Glutamine amidotransferase n=1 Tax=Cladophialophora yegresii CBS 114405 TaxID=1182544 RepID=W9VVF5_9EURO|nr:glutamine amidotransferase [Cladophialophora yegresii CBS 114405]EXJ56181.1 glutamine amidotransferase [Cladophialophora yegresii CBS 114405]
MCRFMVYKGSKPIILSKLITEPSHSILTQSYDSRLRLDSRRPVNGDGFGVGWYTEPELGPDPCIFTSTLPAWNCVNLERIAPKTASRLVFAHVRATTEGSLAENNCHPFQHNTLMWMHNGNIGAWTYVKRPLADCLSDKWFLGVKGGTDSEWAFALFLDTLEREGVDPSAEPEGGFDTKSLRRAMKKTIAKINEFVKAVPAEHKLADVETRSLLNFAVTDGHSVIVTRYVSSKTDAAASLYYSSGTAWVEGKTKGQFKMERRDKASDVVLVASEPLTFERHNWLSVPTNTIVTICRQTVYVRPIKDEYYDPDPSTERSTGFARSKGLVAKAPGGGTQTPTPAATSVPRNEVEKPNGEYIVKEDLERFQEEMSKLQLHSDQRINGRAGDQLVL